jgi:type IV pilus assembly protein PilB
MELLEHFFQSGIIDEDTAKRIKAAMQERGQSFEQAALSAGVTRSILRDELAQYYDVPSYTLEQNHKIPYQVLSTIPEESAKHYRIIPLTVEDGILTVGANDPDDLQIREVLNFISTKHDVTFRLVFMLADDITNAIAQYESLTGEVDEALTTLQNEAKKQQETEEKDTAQAKENLNHIKEDAPVTKIVGTILRYAVDGGASDIHVEPTDEKIGVRFRVDGSLQHSLELPKNTHSAVVARVKILASMRLDEKRKPQDGRFSATFDGRKIDFRVSVLPTNHDEKVVMRILDNDKGVTDLESTGISSHNLDTIRRMINEPYGIILISGPTGSGKSTTLYTMLSEVDRQTKNVMSLEDPVEYDIDAVTQSQMRPEIGYTFANGLRAALRQDPDIIMVGEIRDKETAQLAIQAALTGHLVLSTIHTNNSIGVIPRLIDMGIDPYLIAPTLKLAVAQRLAKRLCEGTGEEKPVDRAMETMIEKEFETLPEKYHDRIPTNRSILEPESTPECTTGLRGRVAIMETLEVDEGMQDLILQNASEEDFYHHARKHGFMSMKEDAIIKALEHTIPQQEVSLFGTKVGVENLTDDMAQDVVTDTTAEAEKSVSELEVEAEANPVDNSVHEQ